MTYSIGQVAEKFNLTIHTLRYYEKEGLIPFVKRTSSGIRQFDENAIEGLKIVECLKQTGMPLKDIRQFLDWCQEGEDTLRKRRDLFYERKQVVLDQISELNKVLELIKFKCWYYDTALEKGSEKAVMNMSPEEIPEEIMELYKNTH